MELDRLQQQLVVWSDRAAPFEACGLLVERPDGSLEALRAANVAAEPRREFEVDPGLLVRCSRDPRIHIRGVWHSHPTAPPTPSLADRERCPAGWSQVIVGRDPGGDWQVAAF